MKLHCKKINNSLMPVYKSDVEYFSKLKDNAVYAISVTLDRNYLHHKKLFAICKMIISNLPIENIWSNKEAYQLIKAVEEQLGYVIPQMNMKGEVKLEPESINFENWDQIKFSEFYQKAIPFLADYFGYTIDQLDDNYIDYL